MADACRSADGAYPEHEPVIQDAKDLGGGRMKAEFKCGRCGHDWTETYGP